MSAPKPSHQAITGEPGWLPTDAGAAFCWYHPPVEPARDIAILLCDPLGSDRMNLHLTYRHLALALSEAGFPTLRIDYPGSCDSEGYPDDDGLMTASFNALNKGADFLKERSGSRRLAVFGARFGGTIAISFAAQRDDVDLLCTWGACTSGRQYLRNETAFDRLSNSNPTMRKPTYGREGDVEAAGFLYTAQTAESLRGLSVQSLPSTVCTEALVVDWEPAEPEDEIHTALESAGVSVTKLTATDSGAASLHTQSIPSALIVQLTTWLLARSAVSETPQSVEAMYPLQEVKLTSANGRLLSERCVRFGSNEDLFGIITQPVEPLTSSDSNQTIVLVNGGNNHRVGINRNYTEWARRWAEEGFTVLRMDIRGLGDSPPRTQSELNRLYLNHTVEDLNEAADWLQKTQGAERLIFCGLCAGAYQVLQFARARSEIEAVLLLELLRFYDWEPLQAPLPPFPARIRRYWTRFHPMWLVDRNRLGKWLLNLCCSGTKCLIVYREDERMLTRFKAEMSAKKSAIEATGNFQLSELGPSNHIISPLWAQEELTELLTAYLQQLKA